MRNIIFAVLIFAVPLAEGYYRNAKDIVEALNAGQLGLDPRIEVPKRPPLMVSMQLYINHLRINEDPKETIPNVHLTMEWTDERLKFGGSNFAIPTHLISKLWKPSFFIKEAHRVWVAEYPTRYEVLQIGPTGKVTYTIQMWVLAHCDMAQAVRPDPSICKLTFQNYSSRRKGDIIFTMTSLGGFTDVSITDYRLAKVRGPFDCTTKDTPGPCVQIIMDVEKLDFNIRE